MAMTMHVNVVSAEEEIFSGTAEEAYVPAEMGEIGIMPRHAQLVANLSSGEVRIKPQGKTEMESIFVSGGILEIQPHVVTILADTGVRAADLDEAKATAAKQRAEELLASKSDTYDVAQAQAELLAAVEQLRMLDRIRKKRR